jgi:hypothetical protein
MTELDAYERRLERAFARYVEGIPVEVDAAVLTDEIAAAHEHRRIAGWRIGTGGLSLTPGARRAAWVLVAVCLLAVMAIGLALVGAELHREPLPPQRGLAPTDIETLQPDGWAYEQTMADGRGMVWAAGAGHVLRLDPSTGAVRTWTVHDDAMFAAFQRLGPLGSPTRDGGVWLAVERTARRLDGDGIAEVVSAPFEIGALAQGSDGTLWATGTGDARGVYRRDGSAWTEVPGWDAAADPGAIAADERGGAWVAALGPGGTPAGLAHFDGVSWRKWGIDAIPAPPGVIPPLAGSLSAITPTPDGSVWLVTERWSEGAGNRTLLRFDGSSWTEFGSEVVGFDPSDVSIGPNGIVWAAGELPASDGVRVARFDGELWTSWGPGDGLPGFGVGGNGPTVAAVKGAVYAGTGSGLYRLGDRWERAWPAAQEGPAEAGTLVAISRDEAWAGDWSGSGVWHYQQGRWASASAGLPADAIVFDLARAPDGRMWAATEKGVAVLDDNRWTVVDERWSRGLAFAADGTVWVGGHGDEGGIRMVRPTADGWAASSVTTTGLPRTVVGHLAIGRDGTVWADDSDWATPPGLVRFDGTAWKPVDVLPRASSFGVEQVIVVAPDGDVWVQLGEGTKAVARFDGTAWRIYRAAEGLPGDPGWLDLGPDGQPWVSGSEGLARFDGERWVGVRDGPEISWPARFSVAPDRTVWLTGPSMVGRIETTSP